MSTSPPPPIWRLLVAVSFMGCYLYILLLDKIQNNDTPPPLSLAPPGGQESSSFPSFTSSTSKCQNITIDPASYTSQSGEDKALMKWFSNLCNGRYIEMGALNGRRYSNSHVFNMSPLQWKGVLIELMEHNYKELIKNRPEEIAIIHAGVCNEPRTLHAYKGKHRTLNAVGGIYEFTSDTFRKQFWNDISLDDPNVIEIECNTLDNLLLHHDVAKDVSYFDFFSLDVEGAEFGVLQSIDYRRIGFGIILVEADDHNQRKNLAIKMLLESKGYRFLHEYKRSYWFVNSRFHDIYKDLMH